MKTLRVRSKVWLETGGAPLLGEGRELLLCHIRREGSISAAARRMGLSYRKAWSYLDQMEQHLGTPLVHRRKGGARGGTATLTDTAVRLIDRYERLQTEVREFADRRFAEHFASIADPGAD